MLSLAPTWAVMTPSAEEEKTQLGRMVDSRVNFKESYYRATQARPAAAVAAQTKFPPIGNRIVSALALRQTAQPGLQVQLSNLTGSPESIYNRSGALTGAAPGLSSESIVRNYLQQNGDLFGLSASDVDDLVVLGDSAGGSSGLRMLRVEQQIDGRPIFQSETRFTLDRNGRLIKGVGQLVPSARALAPVIDASKLLQPADAIARLAATELKTVDASTFTVTSNTDGRLELRGTSDYIAGPVTARQVLFPLSPGLLVPAWSLVMFTTGSQDWYAIIDAETGDLLWRKGIRDYASAHDARFRVYVQADGVTPADSPAPQSPTLAVPGAGTQAAAIAPTIVSMHTAMDLVASRNGWIDDCPVGGCTANETQTVGNNVIACMDATQGADADICDTSAAFVLDGNGRPTGNPDANLRNRDFLGTTPRDFQGGFLPAPQGGNPEAGQTATGSGTSGTAPIDSFRRGVATHLFYLTNWYHDKLYRLGFDEASGNFQQTNFTGFGLGNDRVKADVQDGSGTNNANFSTPPDGTSGRMQMYRFTGPTINRDGSLDAEIVLHELTHGTSNRLVGNGAGLNWDPARGLGEGWSDFYALSLLNNTNADDPNGSYANGAYATYKLGGLLDNYVYGIRRFPYSTNHAVNPMTWADVDDVTNNLAGGITPSPLNFNGNGGMEVHNSGEIWALTLWGVRARVIANPAGANGDVPTGNQTTLQFVTDGLKLTPINPTFIDGRDAIIQADCATNACANEGSIWAGFADRGLGYGAAAPYKFIGRYVRSHEGIKESFSVPYLDVVNPLTDVTINDSAANNNGAIDPGEAIKITVKLTNPWRAASKGVTGATASLSTTTAGITIWDNTATYGAIAPQGSATGDTFLFTVAPSVAAGSAIDFTLTTVSNLGTTSTTFRLRVGTRNGTDSAVIYTGTPSPALTVLNNQPRGVFHQINVTDDFEIADLNFRIDSITTPAAGDLTAMLRSPQGVGTDLIALIDGQTDLGGTAITNMVIDDDVPLTAANDMVQATTANSPYTKSWSPVYNAPWASLPAVNPSLPDDPVGILSRYDGISTKGTWTALVSDVYSAATGGADGNSTFGGWSIIVTPVHFTITAFVPAVVIAATKTVAGTFAVGGTVNYTVTLTNSGTAGQNDNPGNEFTDVLPASLTLVSASASSGTALATVGTNTVTWNGALAPLGGSVTITITATINAGTQGTTITNQGTVSYDADGNGTNESSKATDDPGAPGGNDPTSFIVGVPPNLAYNPTTPTTIAFTGVTTVGSAGTGSVAVTPSGGSGSGATATSTVNGCAFSGANAANFAGAGLVNLSFVGNTTTAQNISLSCTSGSTARNATLTCNETLGSGAATQRSWALSCPLGNAPPQFGYVPTTGSTVAATGGTLVGSSGALSIVPSVATAGSGSGAAATTTLTCTPPTAPFSGFAQSVTATGSGAISGGPLSGSCTLGATVQAQTLSCSENRGGTSVPVSWTLSCPVGNAPPNLAYNPTTATTVAFTGVTTVGSTGSGSIAVTPSGGSGSGATATSTVNGCAFSGANAANFAGAGAVSLSFVGNTTTVQNVSLTCTSGSTARSATLTCNEQLGSGAATQRSWTLSCPVGSAPPQFGYAPATGTTVAATGGSGVGSTGALGITPSVATSGSGSGAAATTTLTCTPPTAPFSGFAQSVTATGSGAISGGPLSGSCTLGATVQAQTLSCSENRGGTSVPVSWTLSCPVGCSLDVNGDGAVTADKDGVLLSRYLLGFRGAGLIADVPLGPARANAAAVETFIGSAAQYDVFGRPVPAATATQDSLVLIRLMLSVPDTALLGGITLPSGALFTSGSAIRANVNARCGTAY